MHIPKVGDVGTLNGLEFEVTAVGEGFFNARRSNQFVPASFDFADISAFTWQEPPVEWTEGHFKEMKEWCENNEETTYMQDGVYPRLSVRTHDTLDFIRSKIKK